MRNIFAASLRFYGHRVAPSRRRHDHVGHRRMLVTHAPIMAYSALARKCRSSSRAMARWMMRETGREQQKWS